MIGSEKDIIYIYIRIIIMIYNNIIFMYILFPIGSAMWNSAVALINYYFYVEK